MAKKKRKYFGDIVIECKIVPTDFRSFAHVKDSQGQWWELRGYGETAGQAATDAWNNYMSDEDTWDIYGYPIPPPGDSNV